MKPKVSNNGREDPLIEKLLGYEAKSFTLLSGIPLFQSRNFRFLSLLGVFLVSLFLEWYFHVHQGISSVYPHFFYLPILLAGFYYSFAGGFWCSLILALAHILSGLGHAGYDPLLRGVVMVAVGSSLGYIHGLLNRAGRVLAGSEERFRALLERSGLASGIVDTDTGKFLYGNTALIEKLGLASPGEIRAHSWKDFVHPYDLENTERIREAYYNGGPHQVNLDCRLLARDGATFHVTGRLVPLPSTSAALISVMDITERERLEEVTKDNLALFSGLYENAPCALILCTWDDRILHHNRKFRETFAIPEEEQLIGKDLGPIVTGFTDGDLLHEFRALTRKSQAEGGTECEVVRKTWSGEEVTVLLKSVPLDVADDKYCLVMYQDISEVKALALENRRNLGMFKQLFEHSPAALALLDGEENVLDVSQTFLETFRIGNKEDVLGKTLRSLVLADGDETMKEEFEDMYRRRLLGECICIESFRRRKDGQLFPVRITEVPVPYREEKAALTLYVDLTEQKDREHELENAYMHLSNAMEDLVLTVSRILEARDPYTSGHQKRVGELSRRIAREMGLGNEEIRGIYFAGLLHDAGKIRIPAEILSKPGKLSDLEKRLIRIHPEAGAEILGDVKFPWPVTDIIRHHHERLDGSGYPDGLKGDALSTGVRIIAVADVVEAMMNHRPYRPAPGHEKALAEIRRGAGTFYDPRVVEVCIRLLETDADLCQILGANS